MLLLDFPDRKQAQTYIDSFFEDLKQWSMKMPWDRRNQGLVLSDQSMTTMYTVLEKPAFERVGDILWRAKLGTQAAITVLAIKRYQARQGKLPENLQELVTEGLLDKLPRDFYGPGPLIYQRQSDQVFVLYSWGENLKDDHGTPATDNKGELHKYGSQGDWVFWPLHD